MAGQRPEAYRSAGQQMFEMLDANFMNRNASAVWKGNLHEGEGTLTTESGVLSKTQYSFGTSFVEGIGTNPDELIAASLSGCFAMALSNELGRAGFHPETIKTTATTTLEDLAAGWTVTHIQLDVHANVPGASQAQFIDAAIAAKTNCPMARLLKTNISMTATLSHLNAQDPLQLDTSPPPGAETSAATSVNSANSKS